MAVIDPSTTIRTPGTYTVNASLSNERGGVTTTSISIEKDDVVIGSGSSSPTTAEIEIAADESGSFTVETTAVDSLSRVYTDSKEYTYNTISSGYVAVANGAQATNTRLVRFNSSSNDPVDVSSSIKPIYDIVRFTGASTDVLVGGFNEIYKSTDNGDNYSVVSTFASSDQKLYGIEESGGTIVGCGGNGTTGFGFITRSTDEGSNFSVIGTVTGNTLFTVATNGGGTWIATGVLGRTMRSTDDGASFSSLGALFGSNSAYCTYDTYDERFIAVINSSGRVYYSADGSSWTLLSDTSENNVNPSYVAFDETYYYVATRSGTYQGVNRMPKAGPYDWTHVLDTTSDGSDGNGKGIFVLNGSIYFTTKSKIYVSTDSGNNWSVLHTPTLTTGAELSMVKVYQGS